MEKQKNMKNHCKNREKKNGENKNNKKTLRKQKKQLSGSLGEAPQLPEESRICVFFFCFFLKFCRKTTVPITASRAPFGRPCSFWFSRRFFGILKFVESFCFVAARGFSPLPPFLLVKNSSVGKVAFRNVAFFVKKWKRRFRIVSFFTIVSVSCVSTILFIWGCISLWKETCLLRSWSL